MTFKKSWYSYGLWAFYVVFAFAFLIGAVFSMLEYVPGISEYVKIGVACLSFALVTGLFFLIRRQIDGRWKDTTDNGLKREKILEGIAVLIVFAAGILLRIFFWTNSGEEAAYFSLASVDGQPLTQVNHGAVQLYLVLLRGIFLLFGNKYIAGIMLQVVLQTGMAFVWYLAIRKMAGRTAAFVLFAGVMLLPQSVHTSLLYSPKILYLLLFGIGLWMMSCFWNRFYKQSRLTWQAWVQTLLMGVLMGVVLYLDITGMVFLFLLLFALAVQSRPVEIPYTGIQRLLQILLALLASVAAFACAFIAEAQIKGEMSATIADRWFQQFVCKDIPSLEGLGNMLTIDVTNGITALAVSAVLFMAALAFWIHKRRELQMPWFVVTIVLAILYACNFCADSMTCDYMFVLFVLIQAGVGIQAVFLDKQEESLAKTQNKGEESLTRETVAEQKAKTEEEPKKTVKYIENPLPLPKKHAKRTLDYRLEVPKEAMKYDLEVSDNDDFDLK